LWDFDNNGIIDSTDRNPIYMYADPGNYTVNLTVKNAFGSNTAIKNNYIIVSAFNPPIADFSAYPTSGKASLTVKFTDNSTGSITSWYWNFGDKSTSTAKNPVHKYNKAGIYSVSLTARNATGTNIKTMNDYIKVALRNDK
jgi:PKD repeat protein